MISGLTFIYLNILSQHRRKVLILSSRFWHCSPQSHMLEVGSCLAPSGPIPKVRQITVGGEGLPRETGTPIRHTEHGL